MCYVAGRGVEASEAAGFEAFQKAAELGDPTAQYNAGVCLGKGRCVPHSAGAVMRFSRNVE